MHEHKDIVIPAPGRAAELRVFMGEVPAVVKAVTALWEFGAYDVRTVAVLLPHWKHFLDLTPREVEAILATFVPEPANKCLLCDSSILYSTALDRLGWLHDESVQEATGRRTPHTVVPFYPPDGVDEGWTVCGG